MPPNKKVDKAEELTYLSLLQQMPTSAPPRFQPVSCSIFLPLQVFSVDGFVTDGTLSPAVVGQGQVVEDARPAEDVAAAGDLGRSGRVEAAKKTRVC